MSGRRAEMAICAMINRMKRVGPIVLILLIYLVVGSLYAIYTPDWQAPDEPAHYNVVRQLAEGTFPVIEPADYDQDFQGQAISSGFDPVYDVPDRYFSYEDWQPPLYYLLLVPVYWLFDGVLEPLRLASLVLGAGVVLLSYEVARLIWRREAWALTAAAFVAFLPQHLAIMASLNNDALAELLIAAILYLLVRGAVSREPLAVSTLHFPLSTLSVSQSLNLPFPILLLGILLGLGFLTKGSVYIMAPLIGLVFLWCYWGAWRQVVRVGLLVGGAAALLALPWWWRNHVVYGGLDLIAWQAHGEVVVGQPLTVEWLAQFGVNGILQRFLGTTFRSFWGQFGWMGVLMPTWVYQILGLFTVVVMVGVLAAAVQSFHPSRQPPKRHFILHPSSLVLLLNLVFTILLYLGYNITFVQHQGRYLFSALIPLACGVALGLGTLWDKVKELRTTHHAPRTTREVSGFKFQVSEFVLPVGLTIALVGLDLLALFRFILPQLGRG